MEVPFRTNTAAVTRGFLFGSSFASARFVDCGPLLCNFDLEVAKCDLEFIDRPGGWQ
jgi:hypothetical protein